MRPYIVLMLCVLFATVGCGGEVAEPPTLPPPTATTAPTNTPEPTPTHTPTSTPTPEPLTAGDIFELLSPSVAYVRTTSGAGGGALLEGGYILTNAHVVWPHDAADVTFPDGATFEDVPLAARDGLRDIALLGPIDTDLPPIAFADGESAAVGGDILLIGYPGESDRAPQPALTEGLISRVREWEEGGITFFQTSSAVAGGQSGGIAVSPDGDPVGLSGLRFTEANYGLVASATDLLPLVEGLIADATGTAGDAPEPRTIDSDHFDMSMAENARAYRVDAPPGAPVVIAVDGPGDIGLGAYAPDGTELAYADATFSGEETLRFTMPQDDVPIFAVVSYLGDFTGRFALTSDQPLIEIVDLDDGMPVNIGTSYTGTVHYPYDNDALIILLDDGEEVTVRVDTIGFDPMLAIDAKAGVESLVGDDDSGGGLFGMNPELTYRAPGTGTVNAFVFDLAGTGAGSSYTITVNEPYEGAPTPMSPAPTPTPIAAAVGQMRLYDDPLLPFTFEVPVNFGTSNSLICQQVAATGQMGACLSDVPFESGALTIMAITENADQLGVEEFTLEEYVSYLRLAMESNPQVTIAAEHPIETAQGDPAILVEITAPNGGGELRRFVHVYLRKEANNMSFFYDASQQDMVDYIISTYRVRE